MLTYKKPLTILIIVIYMLSMVHSLSACLTTFINDTDHIIYIFDKNTQLVPIKKNEKRRFGNAHKRVDFDIFIQEPHKRIFTKVYTCEQKICSPSGNIILKFSDIKNHDKKVTSFFVIIDYGPHASMADTIISHLKKKVVAQ